MNVVINILVFITTALFMEFVAWALHKYVMHGFLWVLHKGEVCHIFLNGALFSSHNSMAPEK